MDKSRNHQLSQSYLDGTLLPEEWEEMKQYLLAGDSHPEFEAEMEIALATQTYEPVDPAIYERVMKEVLKDLLPVEHKKIRQLPWLRKWGWMAASLILAIGAAAWLWLTDRPAAVPDPVVHHIPDVQPGREGAVLILADGRQVSLDTIRNGTVALQGGVEAKLVNGMLTYEGQAEQAAYNTMSTPNGRQFHLKLPDGTGVWLNAASSIRYPTAFKGQERVVEISGEAYFEVVNNPKKPFKVNIDGKATVEVLGTRFNVNAYADEGNINTSLLEGIVKVIAWQTMVAKDGPASSIASVILKPAQQAQIQQVSRGATEKINVVGIEPSQVMAWKNGLFSFHNAGLEQVMRQLARWYNLKIVYQTKRTDIRFGGEMRRDLKLSNLLKALEGYGVRFRLESPNTLIVLE